jgi:pantothenate synthetase
LLQKALAETARGIGEGRLVSPGEARDFFLAEFAAATLARLDYFEIVEASTLEPLVSFDQGVPRLITAAFFGKTRLIDNLGVGDR